MLYGPSREPFDGVWERIERAQTHRKAFGDEWNAFCETQPYHPGVKVDDDGHGVIWVDCEPLPPDLPLVLGEMLYQLRAALDSCIYEAAIIETGMNPPPDEQYLGWPICHSWAAFKSSSRSIAPLSEQRRDFIKSVQPCNASQIPHPIVRGINTTLGMMRGDGPLEDDPEVATFVLEGWEHGMEIEADPNLLIDISINEVPAPRDDGDTASVGVAGHLVEQ